MQRSLQHLHRQGVRLCGVVIILLALTLVPLAVGATGALDQFFLPTATNVLGEFCVNDADHRSETGQTVTAGITGTLTQVDVYLARNTQNAPGTGPLHVQIQTLASNGAPSGTVLGSADVPASAVPRDTPGWVSVPISAPSVAGNHYAIVLSNDDPQTNYCVSDSRQDMPRYQGGQLWFFVTVNGTSFWETNVALPNDSFFRTFVTPTPTSKDACKDGGWQRFTNPAFKNQGECVAYVVHHH